jgi:hypothetical protein
MSHLISNMVLPRTNRAFGVAMADDLRFVAEHVTAVMIDNSGQHPAATIGLIGVFATRRPHLNRNPASVHRVGRGGVCE